jgi:hypothetical protein
MIWAFPKNGAPTAPYPVFRLDDFWACETPEGVLSLAGRLPWGRLPPFFTHFPNKRIHYTAFRGWDADLWYDGPEFHLESGAVQACVLPGTDAQLPKEGRSDPSGFAAWLQEHEVLAWKKSLAKAFRARFAFTHGPYRLQGLESNPSHVLVLLGLRLAFPHSNFFALDYPGDLKPQWKRYCQNLNLSTWAAPAQLQGLPLIDVNDISRLWPEAAAAQFLQSLNARIPCVPGKLAALFNRP